MGMLLLGFGPLLFLYVYGWIQFIFLITINSKNAIAISKRVFIIVRFLDYFG